MWTHFNFLHYKSCPRIALHRAPASFSTFQPPITIISHVNYIFYFVFHHLIWTQYSVMFCFAFLSPFWIELSELINRLETPWNNKNDEAQHRFARNELSLIIMHARMAKLISIDVAKKFAVLPKAMRLKSWSKCSDEKTEILASKIS